MLHRGSVLSSFFFFFFFFSKDLVETFGRDEIAARASRGTRHFPQEISNSRVSAQVTDSSVWLSPTRGLFIVASDNGDCFILDDASESSLRHLTFSKDAAKDASEEILVESIIYTSRYCLVTGTRRLCFETSSIRRVIFLYIYDRKF